VDDEPIKEINSTGGVMFVEWLTYQSGFRRFFASYSSYTDSNNSSGCSQLHNQNGCSCSSQYDLANDGKTCTKKKPNPNMARYIESPNFCGFEGPLTDTIIILKDANFYPYKNIITCSNKQLILTGPHQPVDTLTDCAYDCSSYYYFVVENGSDCYCGDNYDVEKDVCDKLCLDDYDPKCGNCGKI